MKAKSNLIIRVQRNIGFSKQPVFAVVVSLRKKRPAGKFFEKIGFLGCHSKIGISFFNIERLSYWLLHGAKMTWRVRRVLAILFASKGGVTNNIRKLKKKTF